MHGTRPTGARAAKDSDGHLLRSHNPGLAVDGGWESNVIVHHHAPRGVKCKYSHYHWYIKS